jgi:hypothetical protein
LSIVTDLSREQQTETAIALVRGLLGDRDASKVSVSISRGGTYRIDAEAADGARVAGHAYSTGRK